MLHPKRVNRIEVVATRRHCDVRCPKCYWPWHSRESAEGLTTVECETTVDDARGFDEVLIVPSPCQNTPKSFGVSYDRHANWPIY
jgi:hypothetical protein